MEHWFYHLEHTTLESALPTLLEKTLAKGWRARVQCADGLAMKDLDRYLWTYRKDSFLPHGRDDEPMSDSHPIVLSAKAATVSEDIIFLIGGAEPGDISAVKRCVTLVDSRDDHGRAVARARWAKAKEDGIEVSYWRQNDNGAWGKV